MIILYQKTGFICFMPKLICFFFFTDGGLRIVCTLMSCSYSLCVRHSNINTSVNQYGKNGKKIGLFHMFDVKTYMCTYMVQDKLVYIL